MKRIEIVSNKGMRELLNGNVGAVVFEEGNLRPQVEEVVHQNDSADLTI